MNIKNIVAGVVLFSAVGAAMAEAPYPPETKLVSTKTRAEVIAELQQHVHRVYCSRTMNIR